MNKLLSIVEKLQLTTKLLIGFGVCLSIVTIIGINSISSLRTMTENARFIYEVDLKGVSHLKEANVQLILVGRNLRGMMLADTIQSREMTRTKLDEALVGVQQEIAQARKSVVRPENIKLIEEFEIRFAQYKNNVAKAIELMQKEELHQSAAAAYVRSDEFMKVVNNADGLLDQLARNKENGAQENFEKIQHLAEQTTRLSLLLVLLGLGIGGTIGLLVGRSIYQPTERLRQSIVDLSDGKLDAAIPHVDYPNEIGAVARAVRTLQNVYIAMESQRWVKTHVADISGKLQQAEHYGDLAKNLLSTVCPLLGVGLGVLYINENGQLRLMGSYGWRERKQLNQTLEMGEGLFGQSALERQPITLHNPPEDYVKIGSALGESTPRLVMVLPVIHGGEVLAMLELASFHPVGERETALIDALLPVIAMNMEILGKNLTAQQMMKDAQERAEQMEKQAAQLEEASVEMEAQQSELLKTEEWYRRIVQAAEAMLVVDGQGNIILSNPKAEKILGFDSGTLTGLRVDPLLPAWRELTTTASDATTIGRTEVCRKDGSSSALQVTLTGLPDLGVRTACTCLSLQDLA